MKIKYSTSRIGQIFFTLKHVAKIAYEVRPRMFVAVIVINALWGFSSVPGFYLEKLLLDKLVSGIGSKDIQTVLVPVFYIVFLYLMLQLVRNTLSGFSRLFQRSLSRLLDEEMGVRIGRKLTQLDMGMVENPKYKNKFESIEKESGRRAWGLIFAFSDIPNYFVGFISALFVLVILNPLIPLAIIIFSFPKFIAQSRYIKSDYQLHKDLSTQRRLWNKLNYCLTGNNNYMELKLLDISSYLSVKLHKIINHVLNKEINHFQKREYSRSITDLPLIVVELITSLYLAILVITLKITIGSFQLYIQSLRSAQGNLSGLVYSLLDIYENYIYVNDYVWFLSLKPEIEKQDENAVTIDNISGISFKNVSFKYKKKDPWILKDISFDIKPGEKIALVGENGAGKTTLIKLLGRFYDPQIGKIEISDVNLKEINLKNWRNKLAILFQMFELYPFSAREAIGFGDIKNVGDIKGIKEAAAKSGIDTFIEKLPDKYENPITVEFKKGVQPSIGQWQRFGIARMLFRRSAQVIILDEPTSNVDPEAEEKIFQELNNIAKDKILIFVTQRFSTVRIADRIFVMDNGEITENGTHSELMIKNGKYAKLFKLQQEAYLR